MTSNQITKEVQVFALVTNLFNQKYYTNGTYFELDGVARAITSAFTDPRTVTPAQPLAIYGGVKVRLSSQDSFRPVSEAPLVATTAYRSISDLVHAALGAASLPSHPRWI